MGCTAYNAIKGIQSSGKLSFRVFCRGYKSNLKLNKKDISSYGFLEYLSYPLRFLEKKMGLNINPFKYINHFFGELVRRNLPSCKIYHTWMGISPEAVLKAKKNGATLILEGANSHHMNVAKIMNEEYRKVGMTENLIDLKQVKKDSEIYKLFDYIMCPSDFVYDSFLEQGFNKKQLIKMPYGVDSKNFQVKKKTDNKFRVVFVGSIQLRKGLRYLLQAWEELKLKNAELLIVGRVWPDMRDIVDKYSDDKTIKFVGFNSDPQKFLEISDVFVSPSLEEGSALTCYEAMAYSLPLIATYNTGAIVRDKKDGFITPAGSVRHLKEKVLYFYNNPKEIDKMGKNARKRVENFSWKNYGERISRAYRKILGK